MLQHNNICSIIVVHIGAAAVCKYPLRDRLCNCTSFLSYYLNGAKKTAIAEMAQGISVVHLYPNQLTRLEIGIPKPPEQQKIADCLASLDDLIRAEAQKLDALKAHKKGLMQQLFPASDEVGG